MPESMKKQLLKMREELLKDLDKDLKSEKNDFDTEIGDFYDNADTERGRQLFHLLSGREREKLNAIDDALQRIKDGTYGTCEECGKKISKDRLKIMPFARYCIICQSDLEKQTAKLKEGMEEEFSYKDISIGEVEDTDEST
jgi:DnaK suppressor protein